jgi:hypothetical protein
MTAFKQNEVADIFKFVQRLPEAFIKTMSIVFPQPAVITQTCDETSTDRDGSQHHIDGGRYRWPARNFKGWGP